LADEARWRRCSSCKTPIDFGKPYWVCNVSTCNRPRTGLAFCSVSCWDGHLSVVNHRQSWALEKRAPTRAEWEREQATASPSPPRQGERVEYPASGREASARSEAKSSEPSEVNRRATDQQPRDSRRILPAPAPAKPDPAPRDVLIVASKLKAYVRARAGFNTSDGALEPLSDAVRALCDGAIEKARADGRKTVLDRDFE
jgi:hypothetical protein